LGAKVICCGSAQTFDAASGIKRFIIDETMRKKNNHPLGGEIIIKKKRELLIAQGFRTYVCAHNWARK